jgi:hypothetical protein
MRLFILLFLVSCAAIPMRRDKALVPYVEMFELYSGEKVDFPVVFAVLEDPVVGVCYGFKWPQMYKLVAIDHEYFMSVPDCIKRLLILHELAHCVLDKDHLPEIDIDGLYSPPGIMNAVVDWRFCGNEAQYIDELFLK